MDNERLLELAGIDGIDVTNKRANRLAREILISATPLIERTNDVLQNLDPVKDRLIRETVIHNLLKAIKHQLS